MKQIDDITFIINRGWKQKVGVKIELDTIRDLPEWMDTFFINAGDISDYIETCIFWKHDDIENVYEDIDRLLEDQYEEHLDADGNLYDEPVQHKDGGR